MDKKIKTSDGAARLFKALMALLLCFAFIPSLGLCAHAAWAAGDGPDGDPGSAGLGGEPEMSPKSTTPTIPLSLTLDASKATNTTGMTFTFNADEQGVTSGEEGSFAVPRYDSDEDGDIDSDDDYVAPEDVTLTAAAMTGDTQVLEGAVALPDPALYGHAGVYAYVVTESQTGKPANWDYSDASYKVRVYVVNGENGLEYADTAFTIESISNDDGSSVAREKIAQRAQSRNNNNNNVPENLRQTPDGNYYYQSDNIQYSQGSRIVAYALNRNANSTIALNTLTTTTTPQVGDIVYLPRLIFQTSPQIRSYDQTSGIVTSVDETGVKATFVYAINGNNPIVRTMEISSNWHGTPTYYETPDRYLSNTGVKVQSLAFTNVNTATTNLQVTKDVTGAYGNHSKEFPFTLTVNLPSWASDDSFAVSTTGTLLTGTATDGAGDPIVTTSSRTATVTFNLAHGQSLSIAGLPVGTTFSTSETDSTDGVNVYVPSATYRYDGASNTGDFATNTTSYAAALDSNSVPATSLTVNATAAAANASTMLGEGTGNLVTVTNDLSNPPSPTGIATAVLPYAIMMAVAAGALLALRNRKRDDDIV